MKKIYNIALVFCISLPIPFSVYAVELNMNFIHGGNQLTKKELNLLNNKYVPGEYLVDVELNSKKINKTTLTITKKESEDGDLCLSKSWLENAGISINKKFYQSVFDKKKKCYVLTKEKNSHIDFDNSTQSINFLLPQAGFIVKKIDISNWNYGTNSLRFNYNVNTSVNEKSTDTYASSSIIANVGHWIVNSSANISDNDSNISVASASRAIKPLKSDLTVGKIYGGGSLVGGAGMLGIDLRTNSAMSPGDIGYKPVFSGVAKSNARVTLVQNNNVIYSEMVPPGPFVINDVNLAGRTDVTMTITESDGTKTTKLFPLTVVSSMLSPGDYEYDINIGQRDDSSSERKLNGLFSTLSVSYGFDAFSLQSNVLYYQKYLGVGLGITTGLGRYGTVSLNSAYATAHYDDGKNQSGNNYSLTYSKAFKTGTNLSASMTQYSASKYIDFSTFTPWDSNNNDDRNNRIVNQYSLSVSQSTDWNTSFSLSGWQRNYQNSTDNSEGINASISTSFGDVSLNVGSSYSKQGDNGAYNISAMVSVPFSFNDTSYYTSSSINSDNNGNSSLSMGVSSSLFDKVNYSISTNRDLTTNDDSYNLSTSYSGDLINGSLSISQNNQSTTGSASFSGGLIVLPQQRDVLLTGNNSGTVIVANVKDEKGIKFHQSPYLSDSSGNVVIPASSYRDNDITLDGDTLPLDTELMSTDKHVVPTNNAVVYLPFKAVKVKRYLLQIKDNKGNFIKDGTWASTLSGKPLGFISQHGVLYFNSLKKSEGIMLGKCKIPANKIQDTSELQEVNCE
ncbi:PefC/AfrB family outer membrane usher protein [Photobacterium leiognathi]|uniref:PefC/AfrB family outer membrane usher protein n=1 Tax=Photobacterium leiognathi TaxID=553611 RepID=UPI002981E321|nr:PefC/AfrB family outer membrane usher protein [Photobacterium leiognathi]